MTSHLDIAAAYENQWVERRLTPEAYRQTVILLEKEISALPQVDCPVTHHFSNGVYARECFIPSGSVVVGKIHRQECINILAQGELTLVTEEGLQRITAPYTFISPPFTKKAAIAHSDVVFINVIATDKTDPGEIETDMVCQSYDNPEFLQYTHQALKE